MRNSDLNTLQQGAEWLSQGHEIRLISIVEVSGATPRPIGSIAIISDQGHIAGSVSGGCVEEELLDSLVKKNSDTPQLIDYGLPKNGVKFRGLPCGSRMQLLVTRLQDFEQLNSWIDILKRRKVALYTHDLISGESQIGVVPKALPFRYIPNQSISHYFGPSWRMFLIGANEISYQLAQIALTLDYDVEVCDPRVSYQDAWDLPNVKLTQQMPDEFVCQMKPDSRTVAVALAHDPRVDDFALIEALKSDCFYVGALGSLQTSQKRKKRLAEFLTDSELQRLHGPVGLDIGSRTPSEISISILAEITALRNNKTL